MLAYRFSHAKQVSQDMLTTFNDNSDLLKKVITGNESVESTFQMSLHM